LILGEGFKPQDCEYLIPVVYKGSVQAFPDNSFRRYKRRMEEVSGVAFKLKDHRSSNTQILKALGSMSRPYLSIWDTPQPRSRNAFTHV